MCAQCSHTPSLLCPRSWARCLSRRRWPRPSPRPSTAPRGAKRRRTRSRTPRAACEPLPPPFPTPPNGARTDPLPLFTHAHTLARTVGAVLDLGVVGGQRLVEPDSSYHVPARPLHAPIGPSHQKTLQSNVSRQSWFFGLFSREPGSGADDTKAVQEADLVNAPSMPAHVGLRWPDLDLDSYIVRPPLADHATSAKEHLERRLASLIPKLMAASHDRARRLQTSSRRLKSVSAEVLITSKGLARDLLEENSLCPSLALAAFATQKLGAASAQQ